MVRSLRPGGSRASSTGSMHPVPQFSRTPAGDSRFEGHERVQYTRDKLLQLREAGDSRFEGHERVQYTRDKLLQLREAGDSRFEGHERVQYTRDKLLQLREAVEVPNDILNIKQDIEVELYGEEQSWGREESNVFVSAEKAVESPQSQSIPIYDDLFARIQDQLHDSDEEQLNPAEPQVLQPSIQDEIHSALDSLNYLLQQDLPILRTNLDAVETCSQVFSTLLKHSSLLSEMQKGILASLQTSVIESLKKYNNAYITLVERHTLDTRRMELKEQTTKAQSSLLSLRMQEKNLNSDVATRESRIAASLTTIEVLKLKLAEEERNLENLRKDQGKDLFLLSNCQQLINDLHLQGKELATRVDELNKSRKEMQPRHLTAKSDSAEIEAEWPILMKTFAILKDSLVNQFQ